MPAMHDLAGVLEGFAIARNSIVSADVVEHIARGLFEDSARQNIRLLEVRFSPDWAFAGHGVGWDAALEALLRAKEQAEGRYGMAIGYIAITSRGLGPDSCARTVDWAIRNKQHILAIDLADNERDFPLRDFVPHVRRAQEAGLKVTIHTGEDTPASFVVETIRLASPDRIGHGIQRAAMKSMTTCSYSKRVPRYKAGGVYLCSYHARYKRPGGLLPTRIW